MVDKQRVRELLEGRRREMGLSLDDMADRTGLERTLLWRQEQGIANLPKPGVAWKICEGYGISMADLLSAAGYQLTSDEVIATNRRQIIEELNLAGYISEKYHLRTANEVASILEEIIDSRKQKELHTENLTGII